MKPGDGETSNKGRSEGPDHGGMAISPVVVPVAVTLTAFNNNSGSPLAAAETLIQNSGRYITRELWYHCWVVRGAWGTAHIEARTTVQARETPHSYPKP